MTWDNYAQNATLADIIKKRRSDTEGFRRLQATKKDGRERSGIRTIPLAPDDVQPGDMVGDEVNDDTYEYKLKRLSTGLYWDKRLMDTSW